MTTFPARYNGHCAECENAIRAGDIITMTDDGATHAACLIPGHRRPEPDPCSVCWLVHPPGACDR